MSSEIRISENDWEDKSDELCPVRQERVIMSSEIRMNENDWSDKSE